MSETPQLFEMEGSSDPAIQKFIEFHKSNPQVYVELRDIALRIKKRGYDFYGIGACYEIVRFHRVMETTDDDFKLCNDYRAYYARLLMRNEPELKGFFRTKKSKADRMGEIE